MQELISKLKSLNLIIPENSKSRLGKDLPFYIDVKRSYGDPESLIMLADYMYEKIPQSTTCIAAKGHGGIPLASTIASRYEFNLSLIRDTPRNHGTKNLIDGHVPTSKDKIVIVDDVFTTGSSLREVIRVLQPTRAKILGCYVVVKRGDSKDFEFPLEYLLTADDLLK